MRLRTRPILALHAVLLCASLSVAPACATSEGLFGNYFHTSWGAGDGAPADVQELAQTPDGWLWAASSSGLYRFDGHRWQRVTAIDGHPLPQSNIMSVAAVDGALWVGYQFGGVSRFKDGTARHYGKEEGLKESTVFSLLGTSSGKMLAALPLGVYELRGERWVRTWPEAPGKAQRFAVSLKEVDGDIWLATETDLLVRRKGQERFETVLEGTERMPLFRGPDGAVWTVRSGTGVLRYDRADGRFVAPGGRARDVGSLHVTRDGSLWLARAGALELADPATLRPIDRLTRERGLSSAEVVSYMEDREGNLWIVTATGIDRLRRNRLHTVRLPADTRTPGVRPAPGGGAWISSSQDVPVRHLAPDGAITELPIRNVQSLVRGPGGVAWFANAQAVLRLDSWGRTTFPVPDADDNPVHNMAPARDGGVWLSLMSRMTIHHLKDGVWTDRKDLVAYPRTTPLFLYEDAQGRLWQGFTRNRLAVADGKTITRYEAAEGLRTGNVTAVADGRGGRMWIGGERALMVLDAGRLVPVLPRDGGDFIGVSGIVQLPGGDLWLHGIDGLSRIPAAELERGLIGGALRVAFERFDFRDGLDGVAPQIRPLPSLSLGEDGRLWYATNNAVGWIDPERRRRNTVAPPVVLLGMTVDGAAHSVTGTPELPSRPGTVQIDYTGVGLGRPERMRFRYRLEGVDHGWQDANDRRSAFYTGLAPGDYAFHVQAANEDMVWNESGARLRFSVAPSPTQTWWFRTICVLLAIAAGWLLVRLRLRQVAGQLRTRYQARIEERERIARELHDTLLQSVQGMVMQVDAAVAPLDDADPLRERVETALVRARHGIAEARDKVQELRTVRPGELAALLRYRGEDLAAGSGTRFRLEVQGKEQLLAPAVHEQLSCIAFEAMENAFRHARAGTVEVLLDFGSDAVTLAVSDDGIGIAAEILAAGERPGHFGMVGMRERAMRIGAQLALNPRDRRGTEWRLALPAQRAYAQPIGAWRRMWAQLRALRREPVQPA